MAGQLIIGVTPEGNPSLFQWLEGIKLETLKVTTKKEVVELQFYNQIPLNDSNHDLQVNFVDCIVRDGV